MALSVDERTTEMLVGVLLAVTFRGTAHAVADHPTPLVFVAVSLGGTFAWALVDAVLSLMQAKGSRLRFAAFAAAAREGASQPPQFEGFARHLDPAGQRFVAPALVQAASSMDAPPTRLQRSDWRNSAAIFAVVFLAGLPPLAPFLVVENLEYAFHISNLVAGALLAGIGAAWGRHHGVSPWGSAAALVLLGAGLVVALLLLGG